ncbi:3-beta hydroxysteroid dehydrogenase [Streptomyces hygroscopicus subsp. hygroscopicus]|uniref:NAD(P)-dependent oxidoreductase n=1 Tax=Streptomyces sp. KHY 26 TaxID=3097359 RepID=UPI0024A20BFF|nr:NAD(P)H-binding protein [Streptomyces hygroscopicus]GLX53194.1 3-beta hydroxysteroid dehydrogenase [Streptomyces hygroscopicus subsp. hygroscopicus]
MRKILIVGGTGYTGTNIATEAVARGHEVASYARSAPKAPVDGVTYTQGEADDAARLVPGQDAVVAALSPRGDLVGRLLGLYQDIAAAADAAGARLIVIGGFSSLRPAPGEPRFAEGDLPEQFRSEAREMDAVREWLTTAAPASLDWTLVSPAGGYGAWAAGERTGTYRVGGEVALLDEQGRSEISGADFALAVVDEIERDAHPRAHISIAY